MGVASWAGLLLLTGHTIQLGLLPPKNVTLTSENCQTFLTWQPTPNSTNLTKYEVERVNDKRSTWIKETSCRGNNLEQTQRCELHLSDLYNYYEARVRAQDGARLSDWTHSNQLQLYKDMVIGPLNLSLAAADGNLTVSILMPSSAMGKMCPQVYLSVLDVQLNLTEGNNNLETIERKNLTRHTFENLKQNINYCVHVKVRDQPAKKSVRCITMPRSQTGENWSMFLLGSVIIIGVPLLGVMGILFFRQFLKLRPSEIEFPKSLRFPNQEPSGSCSAWRPPILLLEENPIASLSTDDDAAEQKTLPGPVIPSSCRVWGVSNYCANGFDHGSFIMAAQGTSLSVSGMESFISSRELVSDEDTPDGRYQGLQGLLESPASPCFSSLGLHLYTTSGNSILPIHKTGSNGEEAKLSSSS